MDNTSIQPKLELDPLPMVTISDNMTIQAMVAQLRVTNVWEDYDKFEEILLIREERANQKIGQLEERIEMNRLEKVHALEEFKKREEMGEKGKKIKEAYETLLKNVKTTKFAERETIDRMKKKNAELESEVSELRKLKNKCVEVTELRKKNAELENEVLELRKLKEKLVQVSDDNAEIRKLNGELEREVYELRKVNEKWVQVSDDNSELRRKNGELETQVCELRKLKGKLGDENTQLRSLLCVVEGERNTLVTLMSKDSELEEEVKKCLANIDELRKENRKLEEEKCKYEKMVEFLNRKFKELQVKVVKLEDDTGRLMSSAVSGGGNNEEGVSANNGVTLNEKDEGDVHDNEFGNDNVKVSLQRNGDIRHSQG